MTPKDQIHKEIVNIKRDISDIKATQELEIRVKPDKYFILLERAIGRSRERAKVFLAIDGVLSVMEIAKEKGLNPVQVRRSTNRLEKEGLIYPVDTKSGSIVYTKYRWATVLRADDWIRDKFKDELD